jgi:hypothetical protein
MVSNGDIGFVRAGQQAEVKVDTFNFTRYGLLRGEMLSVSSDAVIRDRKQDRANDRGLGTESETSEPKGQELNYSARISLDRAAMQIDDRMVKLALGMAVTVEIKTGSRSIFSPGRPTRGTSVKRGSRSRHSETAAATPRWAQRLPAPLFATTRPSDRLDEAIPKVPGIHARTARLMTSGLNSSVPRTVVACL